MGLLGAHVSISGGLTRAFDRGEAFGCDAIQIFTRNQRQWNPPQLSDEAAEAFLTRFETSSIQTVVSHGSYLLNLASPDADQLSKSFAALIDEIDRADRLGIRYFVFHPGSHMGAGEEAGIDIVTAALNHALAERPDSKVRLLLENTAGAGHHLGARFEQFRIILDQVSDPGRIGICFDTAHAFAAGYPLRMSEEIQKTFDEIDALIGLDAIRVFHFNDSKAAFGTHVDRHENIGKGLLGKPIFEFLLNAAMFHDRPMLLETPGGEESYKKDFLILKRLIRYG